MIWIINASNKAKKEGTHFDKVVGLFSILQGLHKSFLTFAKSFLLLLKHVNSEFFTTCNIVINARGFSGENLLMKLFHIVPQPAHHLSYSFEQLSNHSDRSTMIHRWAFFNLQLFHIIHDVPLAQTWVSLHKKLVQIIMGKST